VLITEGDNYTAITLQDEPLVIGTYTITGIDIEPDDISAEALNIASGIAGDFDIDLGFSNTFDGATYQIRIKDSDTRGVIHYSLTDGGPWISAADAALDSNFQFRDVTAGDITIFYRVTRPGTGYYPLFGSAVSTTVNITPLPLTWNIGSSSTHASVNSKVYDGNTAATVLSTNAPSFNEVVSGDTVNLLLTGLRFSFNSAGTHPITLTSWGISGADAGNYTAPTTAPTFNNATINQRQLNWNRGSGLLSPATVTDKAYDGSNSVVTVTNAPNLSIVGDNGVVPGDDVSITVSGVTFAQSSVGNWAVSASGWSLGGTEAGNYLAPTAAPHFSNAAITHKQLEWGVGSDSSRARVDDKVFDGSTPATVQSAPYAPTLIGVVSGEDVTIASGGVVNFAQSNAGAWAVNATGWGITGAAVGNYLAPQEQPLFENANITRRNLSTIPAATVQVAGPYVFTGSAITPPSGDVTVTLTNFSNLYYGTDFTYVASNNTNVGSAALLTVTGAGNFTGSVTGNFTISPKTISGSADISVSGLVGGRITDTTTLTADVSSIIGVPGFSSGTAVTVEYQWYRNGSEISGATGSTYIVGSNPSDPDPVGSIITVRINGNINYSGFIDSNPVTIGLLSLGGDIELISLSAPLAPTTGHTLEVNWLVPPAFGATYSLTWYRDGAVISGASGEQYTITQEDLGKTLSVEIVGTDDYTGSLSDYLLIPSVPPNVPRSISAISGNAQVTLSWSAPDFDGGSVIEYYHVSTDDFLTYDIIPFNAGARITHTVGCLVNDTEYTFSVRAVNSAGNSTSISINATPVEAPQVLSITPTAETIALFGNIPEEGMTEQAVFVVTGINLTSQVVLNANVFSISEFPAWVLPSGLSVESISPEMAIVTITLTVIPNTGETRFGNIGIRNTISNAINGVLPLLQEATSVQTVLYSVTLLNSSTGTSIPSGQSDSVRMFEAGMSVSLVAGRVNGYSFVNWSSSSTGVTFDSARNAVSSFTMPANDVIIRANWSEQSQQIPTAPLEPPAQVPPGDNTGGGVSSGGGTGTGAGGRTDTGVMPDTATSHVSSFAARLRAWLKITYGGFGST